MNNSSEISFKNDQMELDISEITTTESSSGTRTFVKSFNKNDSSIDSNHVTYELPKKQFCFVFISLLLCMIMASLDVTIFASALPVITKEIRASENYVNIIVTYLLANIALQPTICKMAGIFGRRPLILSSLFVFLVGTIICTVSKSYTMMILARAVQGASSGWLASLANIICTDIVPLKEKETYIRILNTTYSLTSIIGPLIGGIFTDFLSWRRAFYINIPLCIISMIGIGLYAKIPNPPGTVIEKIKRIDFIGTYFFIVTMVCLIHAMNWGGSKYEWTSPIILGLVGSFVIFLCCFLFIEHRMAIEPIIPLKLFKRENLCQCFIISFMSGIIYISFNNTFAMLYQDGRGFSATLSGLRVAPAFFAITIANLVCGWLVQKFGYLKEMTIVGSLALFFSCILISLIGENTNFYVEFFIFLFYGICITIPLQLSLVVANISAPLKLSTISTSVTFFFRMIGGVVGNIIFGMLIKNRFIDIYKKAYPNIKHISMNNFLNLENGQHFYVESIQFAYRATYLFPAIIIFLLSIFMKKLQFIKIAKPPKKEPEIFTIPDAF